MLPSFNRAKSKFEEAQFEYEMHRDKRNCLEETMLSLKKEQHTMK